MRKATIKKVTASVLVGALAVTSFGTGSIAMAAKNNTGYSRGDVSVATGSSIDGGAVKEKTEKSGKKGKHTDKEIVSGGAVKEKPEKSEKKENHTYTEVVSKGAIEGKSEKSEKKANRTDKEAVSKGAVEGKTEKSGKKGNRTDKEVVSGGAVATKQEESKKNKTTKNVKVKGESTYETITTNVKVK